MNLWINSRATHWTGEGDLHSVYFVMDGEAVVSDYYDTRAEAEAALNEITEMARFAA